MESRTETDTKYQRGMGTTRNCASHSITGLHGIEVEYKAPTGNIISHSTPQRSVGREAQARNSLANRATDKDYKDMLAKSAQMGPQAEQANPV